MTKKLLVGLVVLPIAYGAYKLFKSRPSAAVPAKPVAPPVVETESIPTMTALPEAPPRSVKTARKPRTTAPRRARRSTKKKA